MKATLPPDFADLLTAFAEAEVRALVIGGYAVAWHGRPRATKDLDLFVDASPENLARAVRALAAFGAPLAVIESLRTMRADEVIWFGSPPLRIDLLGHVDGLAFESAWARAICVTVDDHEIRVLSLEDLLASKRAAGRLQDLADVALLTAPPDPTD